MATVAELDVRLGNGMVWLTERDPDGAFYIWFRAGLSESTRIPAQSDEVRAAWREWVPQMRNFWTLMDERDRLAKLEGVL